LKSCSLEVTLPFEEEGRPDLLPVFERLASNSFLHSLTIYHSHELPAGDIL
jgi:hypothetical protein